METTWNDNDCCLNIVIAPKLADSTCKDCLKKFKAVYYRVIMDDVFVLSASLDQLKLSQIYLTSKYLSTNSLFKDVAKGKVTYLDNL